MDEQALRAEVGATYTRYLSAFVASDLDTINSLVAYPLAHIGDGAVRLYDEFPLNPAELRRAKQWHTTVNSEVEVVAVSPTKAHVILRTADRLRQDGSLIETVSAFYAFKNTGDGWKLFAISDVVNGATPDS
jgi:hypothetical protein